MSAIGGEDAEEHPPERAVAPLSGRAEIAIGCAGFALAVGAAAVGLADTGGDHRVFSGLANAITVAILFAVGMISWAHGRDARFGRLLVIAGAGWALVSLATSDVAALYSVGRASAWVFEAFLIYLFLAYPRGVLETRAERAVVAVAAGALAVLYLPTLPLVEYFLTPSPYSICGTDCPANALALTGSEPGWVDGFARPLGEFLYGAAYLATAALLVVRLDRASPPLRRTLVPVTATAAISALTASLYLAARNAGVGEGTLDALGHLHNLMLPVTALGFLAGLILWRLHGARALERLAHSAESRESPARLQALLGEALDDPSLEILYRFDGGWRRSDRSVAPDPTSAGQHGERCVVELPTAAIVCDPALENQRAMVEAAAAWVTVSTERERLNRLVSDSLRDVEESRHRLATAAAAERRRIERDLHDGAQQRLVTLRVQLGLIEEDLEQDPAGGAERLHQLGASVEAVIDDVRSLARGIYPPLLADAGVVEALRAVAAREAMTVHIDADEPRRQPLEVESAVYFCCLEALQNAGKHSGASSASIRIEFSDEELRFSVRDEGHGFDASKGARGAGLTNMHDRLAAVGGRLEIESSSAGTCVRGTVPTQPQAQAVAEAW